jgi:hypothetical protein
MKKLFGAGDYFVANVVCRDKRNEHTIGYGVHRWYYIFGFRRYVIISVHLSKYEAIDELKMRQRVSDSLKLIYSDMRKRLYIIGAVFFALCSFAWLASGLYVLEPKRINVSIIAFGYIVFSLASYTMWDDYKKLKKSRPQKF